MVTILKKGRGRFYGLPLYSVWVFTSLQELQVLRVLQVLRPS
jgi:hypothetical protein